MDSDPGNATIVRSTIELAHNLGLEVVAEGVETLATWNTLKELGCDIGQGFYFSKPLPPEKLPKWVNNQATAWAFATSVESTQAPVGVPE
jgi:EAL domain-containing protein (putative c-di-GMP-specific phosphodiesterase class I)